MLDLIGYIFGGLICLALLYVGFIMTVLFIKFVKNPNPSNW